MKEGKIARARGGGNTMITKCAWCGRIMSYIPGKGAEISHGICAECFRIKING